MQQDPSLSPGQGRRESRQALLSAGGFVASATAPWPSSVVAHGEYNFIPDSS